MEIEGFAQSYSYSSAGGETTREVSSDTSSQSNQSQETSSEDSGNSVDVKA